MPTTQQQQQRFNTFWQYRALTHQLIQMGSAPPPGVAVEGAVPCNGKGGRGKHTLWAALPVGEEGLEKSVQTLGEDELMCFCAGSPH